MSPGNRKLYTAAIIIVSAIVIVGGISLSLYYTSHNTTNKEIKGVISIYPDKAPASLIGANVQIWDLAPPDGSSVMSTQTSYNVSPIAETETNSTGNASIVFPSEFESVVSGWAKYFLSLGRQGETSLELQITYLFTYNATKDRIVLYSDAFPYDPNLVLNTLSIIITDHPSLGDQPTFIVNSTNSSSSSPGTVPPPKLPGNTYEWEWVLEEQTVFNNAEVPVSWVNDSNGNAQLTDSLSIGSFNGQTSFNGADGYHVNDTYSWYIQNNGSWSIDNVFNSTGVTTEPPSANKTASAAYIYLVGNVTVDKYREEEIVNGVPSWLNNYEAMMFISSLNVHDGAFQMGHVYDGWSPSSPYTSPQAISQLGWTGALVNEAQYNITPQSQVSWSTVYDQVSGNYNNIDGTINGIIGLGISYLSMVVAAAAADGWAPGSGWADIASDILAETGLVSSVIGLVLGGAVTASSNVVVFGGYYQNAGEYGNPDDGNTIHLTDYSMNTTVAFNGVPYNFPVMDGLGTALS
ncbi:MAG: hypothetical protein ACP5NO_08105 [Thermoplasmata archaeon]